MPDPEDVNITTEKNLMFLPDDTSIDLTLVCTVTLPPTVDIPVMVATRWRQPNGTDNNVNANRMPMNGNVYTSIITYHSISIMNAGQYGCVARIRTQMQNMFVTEQHNLSNENVTNIALCEF